MKKLIVVLVLVLSMGIVNAGDLEDFKEEKEKLIKKREQFNLNVAMRISQLDALIEYIQKKEAEKKSKKKKIDDK